MSVNNNISLGVGNCSMSPELGPYYQDLKQAIYHFDNNNLGRFDEKGIPYLVEKERNYYNAVYVIQYALIQFEFLYLNDKPEEREKTIQSCVSWLVEHAEHYHDSIVWRSEENHHYNLKKGWVSAMYQGQAISLLLRAYQHFGDKTYLDISQKVFGFFKYDFKEGGVRRIDKNGNLWFEEYPTDPPSFVLNGFIYTMFGILDFYRVTKNVEAKKLFDDCVETLKINLPKYHRFYWSVYDQLKKELVSYYYQKNVHIPLMKIMHSLTQEEIFALYTKKWEKQLNSQIGLIFVQVMYRVQPRLQKLRK
jgi:heparosan-N-sulfate-glucuronate 5-epimerase